MPFSLTHRHLVHTLAVAGGKRDMPPNRSRDSISFAPKDEVGPEEKPACFGFLKCSKCSTSKWVPSTSSVRLRGLSLAFALVWGDHFAPPPPVVFRRKLENEEEQRNQTWHTFQLINFTSTVKNCLGHIRSGHQVESRDLTFKRLMLVPQLQFLTEFFSSFQNLIKPLVPTFCISRIYLYIYMTWVRSSSWPLHYKSMGEILKSFPTHH